MDSKDIKLNIDALDTTIKFLDKASKKAEQWHFGQRLVAAAVLIFSAISLVFGFSQPHIVLSIVLLIFGVSFLTIKRKLLVAEHVVVRDKNGVGRAMITAHKGVAQFAAFDNKGDVRANMEVKEDGTPLLTLFDPHVKPRICLLVHPETGPGFTILDVKGNNRLVLNLRENLSGQMALCDEDGTPLLMAAEGGNETHIAGRNEKGEITWIVPSD